MGTWRACITAWIVATPACLGCADDPEPSSDQEVSEPILSSECREVADRVEHAFRRFESSDRGLFRGESPAPFSERGDSLETTLPQLVVGPEVVRFGGTEVSVEDPSPVLAAELEMRRLLFLRTNPEGAWPQAVLLYVPNHTPLSRLRDALRDLPPTLRYDLVVQYTAGERVEIPRPPRWLDRELGHLRDVPSMTDRRERLRQLFVRAAGSCAPARVLGPLLFGGGGRVPSAEESPEATLGEALRRCRCDRIDVDALVAIGILTGPPNRYPLRALPFRRAAAEGEATVRADGARPVEWLVEQLEGAGSPAVYFE